MVSPGETPCLDTRMPSLLLQLERWDERLLFAVVARRRPILDRAMRAITHLADWPVAVAIALSCSPSR